MASAKYDYKIIAPSGILSTTIEAAVNSWNTYLREDNDDINEMRERQDIEELFPQGKSNIK